MKGFKKLLVTLIILTLIISAITYAAGTKMTIEVLMNSINLTVNGKKVDADTIVYNGTTYVPLRATAEMLGKEVGWNQETQTASIDDKKVDIIKPSEKEKEPEKPVSSSVVETLAQKNAVKKAQTYLDFSAFSKSGLIKQLEYEEFNTEDATYAVNKIKVDWKEQAYKKAQTYLDFTAFSKSGLIKQLEYEGFSKEEAEYAVNKIGL